MKNAPDHPVAELAAPLASFYTPQAEDNRTFNETKLASSPVDQAEKDIGALLEAMVRTRRHQNKLPNYTPDPDCLTLPPAAREATTIASLPTGLQPADWQAGLLALHLEQPYPDTFRILLANLRKRGIDTTAFRRSTKLQPLLRRYAVEITEEVALISPQALPAFVHQENIYSRAGLNLVVLALLATLGFGLAHSVIACWTAGLVLPGCLLVLRGEKMPPRPISLKGLDTLDDLVKRMDIRQGD